MALRLIKVITTPCMYWPASWTELRAICDMHRHNTSIRCNIHKLYTFSHHLSPTKDDMSQALLFFSMQQKIFVNFVIEFAITKILFTKYLYVRIVLLCRRAVAKFIFHEL